MKHRKASSQRISVGWSYHISGDNFVACLYGSVGHFFVLKLPQNLYSFKHFSTSRVRSGQIEPKLLERVVNQPQYSLNLAHLRGKPYDMGVYGCQSGDHEVNNLSRCFFVTSARIIFSNAFVISSAGMNSSEGVRNLFPIVKYDRTWSVNALSITKVRLKFWKRWEQLFICVTCLLILAFKSCHLW